MRRRHDPDAERGGDAPRREPRRDEVLARKRAKVALIERIEGDPRVGRSASRGEADSAAEHPAAGGAVSTGGVSAIRLLAEVDLALSEHRATV